jgi:hypothetical protein
MTGMPHRRYRVCNGVGRFGVERVPLHELARRLGIKITVSPFCAYGRLRKGWEPRRALTEPARHGGAR